jgi:hypothetical protein
VAAAVMLLAGHAVRGRAAELRVPAQVAGIQAAIDLAQPGDTVLIDRGTYTGALVISGKSIVLASRFIETGDTNDISLTTITGSGTLLSILATAGSTTTVRGLTFLNGSYQIENYARRMNVLDDHFIGCDADQMSFEGAGGLVRGCHFRNSGDDAIDVDDASDPDIEDNTIVSAGDDGIELRLQPYTGTTMQVVFRNNYMTGCREDGIQLIDYAGASSRDFLIEGNVLVHNVKGGLTCMADGNTIENYLGAPMVEPARVIGNTICGNVVGVTGGDNMLLMNNIITGNAQAGVKRVGGSSLVTYDDIWNNVPNTMTSIVDTTTTLHVNPLLQPSYDLESGSPCIDAGAISQLWNGKRVSAGTYLGMAPDLGAREAPYGLTVSAPPPATRAGLVIEAVRPNPTSSSVAISFTLPERSPVRLELMDPAGRRILVRDLGELDRGPHIERLPEARALPAGVYVVRVVQGGRSVAAPVVIAR